MKKSKRIIRYPKRLFFLVRKINLYLRDRENQEAFFNKQRPPEKEVTTGSQAEINGVKTPFTPSELDKKEII